MYLPVQLEVDPQRVTDLLVAAFEGGSTYWIESIKQSKPTKSGETVEACHSIRYYSDVPMLGGELTITINEPFEEDGATEFTLDHDLCESGLALMANTHYRHFANWLAEDDDAETADVFLQLALFGELIFG